MKNYKYVVMSLLLLAVFFFQPTKASAVDNVNFEFYYQTIEDIKTINEPIDDDDSLWEKGKKLFKSGVNAVKRTWENVVTRNLTLDEGDSTWYSSEDHNIAYNVKRVKVTSEAELLAAMGAKSESELSNGQKALLATFRQANSETVANRAKDSYRSKVNVILSDTTGFEDAKKYPTVRKDFWSYSSGFTIQMCSNNYNGANGPADAASTFVHEYAHSMDMTVKELINPYGKDGDHYANEITGPRSAFVEAWAEYNEMIESPSEAKYYQNCCNKLMLESKDVAGEYTYLKPEECTGEQLLNCECYLACILYRITNECENGREKVFEAFTDTRWKIFRDASTLIKRIIKNNPEDAAKIAKIVDEVTLGKLSDKELLDMVGKTEATKAYASNRGAAVEEDTTTVNNEIKAEAAAEVLNVETETDNPFSVR